MKRLILIFTISFVAAICFADVNTDKAMAKISQDTKNYISADVRAATEDIAYNEAMEKLSAKIADYFKNERSEASLPESIYLPNLSSIYERMTSKISENRYRVMLYVKKSDLIPMDGEANVIILSKDDSDNYTPVTTDNSQSQSVVTSPKEPLNPTLLQIIQLRKRDDLVQFLQSLRKSGQIDGAAAFPVNSASNFYVAVVNQNEVVKVVHFIDGQYVDLTTAELIDMSAYSLCSGYWFVLPTAK